jgi:two-component system phosphate regulon response regulator OmpR
VVDGPHILVVDDDNRLRDLLRKYLADNGFRVSVAGDAAEARKTLASFDFDLMVLDLMMPGETGLELARSLRKERRVPILMLTAMGESADRITGLETGADDYLTKPFEPRELLLRINSILRRVNEMPQAPPVVAEEISFGPFRFDLVRGELKRGEERIKLTDAERGLLAALARTPGATLSRDDLARLTVPGNNARTIDVQVTRLRRKIEPDPKFPRYLQTARGRGYRLATE